MTKFKGTVGYVETVETEPGVFEEITTEKEIRGDILRSNQSWQTPDKINNDFVLNNRFSFVCDAYLQGNLNRIRFVKYLGTKWKVTSAELQHPRVVVSVGGIYNG